MYKEFWTLFFKGYGRLRLSALLSLITIVASLLEGFNISLMVPLLESLNSAEPAGGHWVSRGIGNIFEALGLPFRLETILLALGLLVLLVAALKYLRMVLASKLRVGFMLWLRSQTMKNLLHADVSYFHQEKLGDISNVLTMQAQLAGAMLFSVTELFTVLWLVLAYLVAAFLISPVLTAVAFGLILAVTLAMQSRVSRAGVIGNSLVERNQALESTALESLIGIRTIKSFVLERLRWSQFDTTAAEVSQAQFQQDHNRSQMFVLQETAMFGLVGVLVYLGVAVLDLNFAVIVAILFILYRLAPRVTTLNSHRQTIAATLPSFHQVKTVMDDTSAPRVSSGDQAFAGLRHGIELRQVDFSYNGVTDVLKGANFGIEKGKMTAIVGTSGAGKSTLVDLLLRFHDPVNGQILVDGVDLRQLKLESWRRAIGVVSQDIFLFNDTIYSNIAIGAPEASREDVVAAARGAYADDFIRQLPLGYDTIVGDRGWNLSGGQRQRIALARAILRKPQILILDEATSSLDSESEQLVQKYITGIRGSITLVIVAHRTSTVQDADKIVVLQDGKITEEGDWDSLLAEAGVFANYHRLQSGG